MRGRGISFHGPVNSGEVGEHRSKPKVVLALQNQLASIIALNLIIKHRPTISCNGDQPTSSILLAEHL